MERVQEEGRDKTLSRWEMCSSRFKPAIAFWGPIWDGEQRWRPYAALGSLRDPNPGLATGARNAVAALRLDWVVLLASC
jgi:hypothetical protein